MVIKRSYLPNCIYIYQAMNSTKKTLMVRLRGHFKWFSFIIRRWKKNLGAFDVRQATLQATRNWGSLLKYISFNFPNGLYSLPVLVFCYEF